MSQNDSNLDRMNHSRRAMLDPLRREYPTVDAAEAQIARLSAELTLPKGIVHILSDVHGEDVKLRHVINNASGTLRPLVERLHAGKLSAEAIKELLTLLFYPREFLAELEPNLKDRDAKLATVRRLFPPMLDVIRFLATRSSQVRLEAALPADYAELLKELLVGPTDGPRARYLDAILERLVERGRAFHFLHLCVRTLRNLTIEELIIAGDCFDRGPRADRVVDYLMHQPHVAFTWGNHDTAWIGACLGSEALIAHVLRVSIRYRRLSQLEEGYGITMQPLEHLVRSVYENDPATCFVPKGTGLRETLTMARMQKAAAVMQYKLEGQLIQRHPEFKLQHRCLLHRLDLAAGTVEIDGTPRPLKDKNFPTIDPAKPYELSAEERICMDRLRQSFTASTKLWNHARFLVEKGAMYLRRDNHLIFHGCVPVDEKGALLSFAIDGKEYSGRPLFDAFERVVVRSLEDGRSQSDVDLLWYLWCGPMSPLFGKDRITTFENDLVNDPAAKVETKNPYFKLIHEVPFCDSVMQLFDVDPAVGLIVNGHVPVKLDKGENPIKKSGKCITIDGAFSPAYGDHGFTLILESDRTSLARHHHFDSVAKAVKEGVDIIPSVTVVKEWGPSRQVGDTERGADLRERIRLLEDLVNAYQTNGLIIR